MKKYFVLVLILSVGFLPLACQQPSLPSQPDSTIHTMTGPPTEVLTVIATHNPNGGPPGILTAQPTATATHTPTNSPVNTSTNTPTSTPTATSTPSSTPTATDTSTATGTFSSTPTDTATSTATNTPTVSQPHAFVTSWGSTAAAGYGTLAGPQAVALNSAGTTLYVADTANKRIVAFDPSGNFLTQWSNYSSGSTPFTQPVGLSVDGSGNVYVADAYSNNFIEEFTYNGTPVTFWGGLGFSGNGFFNGANGVAVNAAGTTVFAVDSGGEHIEVFSPPGNFVKQWGSIGSGNYQYEEPTGAALDGADNLYIADNFNQRIMVYDNTQTFVKQIGTGTAGAACNQFEDPFGMTVDGSGNVFVADSFNYRISVFTPLPVCACLTQWGSFGTGNYQFNDPCGVAVDGGGFVYVADRNNNRIVKYGP